MSDYDTGRVFRLPPWKGLPTCDIRPSEFDAECERRRVRLMRECVATGMRRKQIHESEAGKAYDQISNAVLVRKRSF